MKTTKRTERTIGILFLAIMATWTIGHSLIDGLISDPGSMEQLNMHRARIITGVLFEVLEIVAVLGLSVLLFSLLKRYSENLARAYFGFRILECMLLIIIALCPILLLAAEGAMLRGLLISLRNEGSQLVLTIFYCTAAFILNLVLYRTKWVPRLFSVWGLLGSVIVLAHTLYYSYGYAPIPFLGMVMGVYELALGIWLIVRGFQTEPSLSE